MTQNKKSRITVEINRTNYTIVGNESAEHVRHVSGLVNDKAGGLSVFTSL